MIYHYAYEIFAANKFLHLQRTFSSIHVVIVERISAFFIMHREKNRRLQSNPATPPKKTARRFVLFKVSNVIQLARNGISILRSQIQTKFQNKFKKYSADKRLCYSAVLLWFSTKPDAPEKYLCRACRQTSMIGGIFPFNGIFDKTRGVWRSIMWNYTVFTQVRGRMNKTDG